MTSMAIAFDQARARRHTRAEKRALRARTVPAAEPVEDLEDLKAELWALGNQVRVRDQGPVCKQARPVSVRPKPAVRVTVHSHERRPLRHGEAVVDLANVRPSERAVVLNIALRELERDRVRELGHTIGPNFGFVLI